MRVLHINTETGFRGGERQLLLLSRGLKAHGVTQTVIAPRGAEMHEHLKAEGVPTRAYKKPKLLGMRSPILGAWLQRVVESFEPDIVHAHTGNAHTLAITALHGKVKILTTRRVDFPIRDNAISRRKYTAPNQHFIAISQAIREVLMDGGVFGSKIDVVYSGIEPEAVRGGNGKALREEWLAGAEGPLIGFVGALVDHKSPWILAEAAPVIRERLPGAKAVFAGDGVKRYRIRDVRDQHPDAIVMAGHRDDIPDCLDAFDLFVMPSRLEGLCTSLLDAMAAGLPCIGSRAGGIPEVILDGETGILVPPLDSQALADAVVKLWQDESLRKNFVEAATKRLETTFTVETMVAGNLAVYEKLLT